MFESLSAHLPIQNPIAVFLTVLLVVLSVPLLLKKGHIPYIAGMILAGLVLGPNALNILPLDRSFDLFGNVGLLYVMFLAGVEIDIRNFIQNRSKGLIFGLITFIIPLIFGLFSGHVLLQYSLPSALLMAAMFSSHTLVAFPVVSRYGLSGRSAVNIAVGATVVAVTLSLMVLAAVGGMHTEGKGEHFMLWISLKLLVVLLVIFFALPFFTRRFLRHFQDGVLQVVFVLAMAFLGALLTDWAGFQGVLGAFLAGLALNKEIPKLSSLMNRIEFMGNALFIPYFLIGTGMMINLQVFAQSWRSVYVCLVMCLTVLSSKWLAARLAGLFFRMRSDEKNMLFGLTMGRAAVTLAVVTIGCSTLIGHADDGTPLYFFDEYVLNGTVLMILISCIVSSVVTESSAKKMLLEAVKTTRNEPYAGNKIMVALSKTQAVENLMWMAALMSREKDRLVAMHVHDETQGDVEDWSVLEQASRYASSLDLKCQTLYRYDTDIIGGIVHAAKEQQASDVLLGLHVTTALEDGLISNEIKNLLERILKNIYVCRFVLPIRKIRRIVLFVPEKAEYEQGFVSWVERVMQLRSHTHSLMTVYAHPMTMKSLRFLLEKEENAETGIQWNELYNWNNLYMLSEDIRRNELPVFVLARQGSISYQASLKALPGQLETYFPQQNLMLIYPDQSDYEQQRLTFDPILWRNQTELNEIQTLQSSSEKPSEFVKEVQRKIAKSKAKQ